MFFTQTGWLNNTIVRGYHIFHTEEIEAQRDGITWQGYTISKWQNWELNSGILTLARPVLSYYSIPLKIIDKTKINDKFGKAGRNSKWRSRG